MFDQKNHQLITFQSKMIAYCEWRDFQMEELVDVVVVVAECDCSILS